MSALSFSLLGAIAFPSAIFAEFDVSSSVNPATPEAPVTQPVGDGDHVVTPQTAIDAIDIGLTGGATVQGYFDVPKGYGHVKLRIKNNSGHRVKVSLTHVESKKLYIDELTIGAYGTENWKSTDAGYSSGMRSGSYAIQFRGGDYKVDGHVYGVIATESTDL
ncbi:hypothetical protein ASL14_12205 [Paenibacillus sp. IHB B 3084]|nr:hypothetical protein ASL14_12205 [Paenibacillus sp. IHB B 3084]